MFGRENREIGLIREHLGIFPVGFYAGGEIPPASTPYRVLVLSFERALGIPTCAFHRPPLPEDARVRLAAPQSGVPARAGSTRTTCITIRFLGEPTATPPRT